MDRNRLVCAIEGLVGRDIAEALVSDFAKLRRDVSTATLERAMGGKFVESFVKALKHMSGQDMKRPTGIDHYLNNLAVSDSTLPEGLRVCATRVARVIYTFRNKRSIAHRNEVNPNRTDLELTYHAAAWIMAELIRSASNDADMEEASKLISYVTMPVGILVEDFNGTRRVLAEATVPVKILLLLHSRFPDLTSMKELLEWTDAKSNTTRSALNRLCKKALVFGNAKKGFTLTSTGCRAANREIRRLTAL